MTNVIEKSISSLSEYVSLIEQASTREKSDLFRDPHVFFRGQSNKEYQLLPSLGRYVNQDALEPLQFTFFERDLILRAKIEYPTLFTNDLLPFMLIAKMQHYGIPTRLLDITSNALVALFFACSSMDFDGEVIVFQTDNVELGFDSEINALADTCNIHAGDNDMSYSRFWEIARRQRYYLARHSINEQIQDDDILRDLPGEKSARASFRPRFVVPQQLTYRQKNQGSLFILFPNAPIHWLDTPGIGDKIDPIEKDSSFVKQRIIIPKNIKEKLIVDLSMLGIEETQLFPEDIDKGCSQIVREYRDRLLRTTGECHDCVG